MSRYSVSIWYISRTIEVVSKLTVLVILCAIYSSALRVTKDIASRSLTNIFNRNYFFNELTVQSASAKTPYCVMIMDIDHFKKVNDTGTSGWRSSDKDSGEYHWEKAYDQMTF